MPLGLGIKVGDRVQSDTHHLNGKPLQGTVSGLEHFPGHSAPSFVRIEWDTDFPLTRFGLPSPVLSRA